MNHVAAFLVILIASVVLTAQTPRNSPKPPPPPAPAIFSSPDVVEIETFRSPSDAFSIEFAGKVSESSERAGQFQIRTYSARRIGTRSTVVVYDFGLSNAGKLNKEEFLNDLKTDLLRVKGTELVSDTPITVDEFSGQEIISKTGYEREITRVVFTETRVFRLSVFVTNWHILSDENKTAFEKEKDRFFSSFKTGKRFYEGAGFSGKVIPPSSRIDLAPEVADSDAPPEPQKGPFKIGEARKGPPPPAVDGPVEIRKEIIPGTIESGGLGGGFGPSSQYEAPPKSELRQFVSDELGFELFWPGAAKSQKRFIVDGSETVFFTDYARAGYGVSVSEFSFKLSDAHPADEVFQYVRTRIRQHGVYTIKSEKAFESGEIKGIEFELESSREFARMRALFDGNRIIEVYASIPLEFVKTVARIKNIDRFDAECGRLFDSFKLKKTNGPANKEVVVDLNSTQAARLPDLALPDDEYDREKGIFISRNGHFSADLPHEPIRMFSLIQEESSATELTQYVVQGPDEMISIGYFDFPSVPPTKAEKRYQANYQRDFVLQSTPGAVLAGEKDLEFQGHFGRQYDLKLDTIDAVLRYIFVDQRIYKIFFAGLKGDKADGERREAFLKSISLGKPPKPEYPPAELPSEFGVEFTDTSASSAYYGFSLDFEEAWGVVEPSFTAEVMKAARAEGDSLEGIQREEHYESIDNTRLLMIIMRFIPEEENPPRITIMAERAGFPNFTAVSAVEAYKAQLDPGERLTGKEGRESFDGVDFAWYESFSTVEKSYLRMYISNRRGVRLIFSLSFTDEAALSKQLQILKSLRFSPQTEQLPMNVPPAPKELRSK